MSNNSTYYDKYLQKKFSVDLQINDINIEVYSSDFKTVISIQEIYSLETRDDHTLIIRIGKEFPFSVLEIADPLLISKIKSKCSHLNIRTSNENKAYKTILLSWLVGFVALGCLLYFGLPWLGEKVALLLPKKTEIEMGEQYYKSFISTAHIDTARTNKCKEFLKIVKYDTTYPLQITVVNSEVKNAFALPGGHIVVYSKIIEDMNSPEEFAALIGHESTHISKRHSTRNLGRSSVISMLSFWFFGDFGVLASLSSNIVNMSYSRELETEADIAGIEVLHTNNLNTQAMIDLFKNLKKEETDLNSQLEYLSTHPLTDDRISKSKEYIKTKNYNTYKTNSELNNWWKGFYAK